MLFVANRNVTLRSKTGHVIYFKANEPREVPQPVRREAMAIGIIPVNAQPDTVETLESEVTRSVPVPNDLRNALIFYALDKLREENETGKFDAAGRPKVDAINAHFHGFLTINANDRTRFWDEYRALHASGEEPVQHKDLASFLDIAGMTSRDEAGDYAKLLGVSDETINSVSIREARRILMNKLFES